MTRTIIVTGGSTGIGAAAVRAFRAQGARVILTGRSAQTEAVAAETGAEAHRVDFADLAQVRGFAERMLAQEARIDVLANNAGGYWADRQLTRDGNEMTFQVNHLAGFLLASLLAPRLVASGGRIINTASMLHGRARLDLTDPGHARNWNGMAAYADSKLMNVLHAQELSRRYPGLQAASFHPGVIGSDFGRNGGAFVRLGYALGRLFMASPATGADTLVWLATSAPGKDWTDGGYYAKRRPAAVNPLATPERAAELWGMSERLVGLA